MTDVRPLKWIELRRFSQLVKRIRRNAGAPAPDGCSPTNESFADVPYTSSAAELPSCRAVVTGAVTPANLPTTPSDGPFTRIAERAFNITTSGCGGVSPPRSSQV